MLNMVKRLIEKHKELILYVVFGMLTTVVNYLIYLPLYNFAHFSAAASNGIAWLGAVIFAYIANKLYVFESRDWSWHVFLPEFFKFVGCRVCSGAAETLIIYFTVDFLAFNGNVMKMLTSILVIILNYIASKLIIFKAK